LTPERHRFPAADIVQVPKAGEASARQQKDPRQSRGSFLRLKSEAPRSETPRSPLYIDAP
jgi:hypothetical protein